MHIKCWSGRVLINANSYYYFQVSFWSSLKWVHRRIIWDSLYKVPGSCMSLVISIIPWTYTILVINYYSHDRHKRKQEPQLPLPAPATELQGPVQHQGVVQISLRVLRWQQRSIKPSVALLSTGTVAVPRSWPCPPQVPWAESWWQGLWGWFL